MILFELSDKNGVDELAWELLDTPEFQRLRRVRQLGVSEFTFPGATHTRFSHCVGVYHVARRLMEVVRRLERKIDRNEPRERVAQLAALLHDLGHGPFSHAFEEAEKARLRDRPGAYKSHEQWTAEIIRRRDGGVRPVLGERADEIAQMLTSEPSDIYAAVVSSSFDADRLDYLQRDKLMTGSGAGGIDFEWLIDNLRVTKVPSESEVESDDPENESDEQPTDPITTFCFAEKASQAAEAFILARYYLYSQVYFHRATRGFEQLLTAFLTTLAAVVAEGGLDAVCLREDHPLASYYAAERPSVEQYLSLDDTSVWSALEAASRGTHPAARELAKRIRERRRLKAIEIATDDPTPTDRARRDHIEDRLKNQIGQTIFVDRPPLTIYGGLKAGEAKPHKRLWVLRADEERAVDITTLSKPINALTEKQQLHRYYFFDDATWESVCGIRG